MPEFLSTAYTARSTRDCSKALREGGPNMRRARRPDCARGEIEIRPEISLKLAVERLRALSKPAHLEIDYSFPPGKLEDIYNRGDMGYMLQQSSRLSAVLVALVSHHDLGLCVLLTRRTSTLRKHAGEVAFPGGKKDNDAETCRATAFREGWEEVRFPDANSSLDGRCRLTVGEVVNYTPQSMHGSYWKNEQVKVVAIHEELWDGQRHYITVESIDENGKKILRQTTTDRVTVKGVEFVCELERLAQPNFSPPMVVTPCVACLDATLLHSLKPSPSEVSDIFLAPLIMFNRDGPHHTFRDMDLSNFHESLGKYRAHHFDIQFGQKHYDVWGQTADVLMYVASVAFNRRPNFEMKSVASRL